MRNMYPGTCYKCGRHVSTGYGFFERCNYLKNGHRKWRVQCVECADGRRVNDDDPAVINAQNRRKNRDKKARCAK